MNDDTTSWQDIINEKSKKIESLKVNGKIIFSLLSEDKKKVYTYILCRFYESDPSKFKELSENNESLKFCCEHFAKVKGVTYTDFEKMYKPGTDKKYTFCNLYRARRDSGIDLPFWQDKFICDICNKFGPEFRFNIQVEFI